MADSKVYTATALSVLISKALGRTVSPKQVRGRVRGDSGTPLLERYAAGHKDAAYASHVYSEREADLIGVAFVKASNARTGGNKSWSPVSKRTASKRAASKSPSAPAKGARVATTTTIPATSASAKS